MKKLQFKLKQLVFFLLLFINGHLFAQTDTLSFLHISDLHVIFNMDAYPHDLMEYRKQKQYDQGEHHLRQFLQTVPRETKSDMVIATGDLVDFFDSKITDGSVLSIQARQFSKLLSDYHIPVYLTLGNHDIFSFDWQINKLEHTQNFAEPARAEWIRNIPCFKNGTYYSEIFQVGQTTYRLIFLDDSFYQFLPEDKTEVPYIDKSQLYWLNAQLHESEEDVEIILMHIPFAESLSPSKSSNELYSALSKNPSCKLILAGHLHKNAMDIFTSGEGKKITQVKTGALVQSIENWRLIRLTEKNILVSVPGKTKNELVIPIK
jgi:DNA repair exonuclease SbcCD nuclease subunit